MSDTTGTNPLGGGGSTITADPTEPRSTSEKTVDVASDAALKAKEVGGAGLDQAKAVATDAKDQAVGLAAQAGDQAKKAVALSKDELRSLAEERTQQVSDGLRSLSRQLAAISTGDESGVVEDIGRDVGSRLATVADRLESDGLDGAVRQVTSLAQRRSGVFLLGAVAAGFVAARVLRDTKDIIADAPPAESGTLGASAAAASDAPEPGEGLTFAPAATPIGSAG